MKYIQLTRGFVAAVDDADFDRVSEFSWYAVIGKTQVYAARKGPRVGGKRQHIHMHRFVLGVSSQVDHIDGNGLNNTRANLRLATNFQNAANRKKKCASTSACPFKGVNFHGGKWQAAITANRKRVYLGTFLDPVSAALAYNRKAQELHGEFARLNDIRAEAQKEQR